MDPSPQPPLPGDAPGTEQKSGWISYTPPKNVLFISPHLDDVAFSCGGTLLRLAAQPNTRVVLCTVFTGSVPYPAGFALRCQTDKGIAPDVDYMALRRDEDRAYATCAGVTETRHLGYQEAPHRGYDSPASLFAGTHGDDMVWCSLIDDFTELNDTLKPTLVFAPQGLGNHVDHLQTIRAASTVFSVERQMLWYRDTPYAIREPLARPSPLLPVDKLVSSRIRLSPGELERKITGCCLYASQIEFQFGGLAGVRDKLTAFHRAEAGVETNLPGQAEIFLTSGRIDFPLPA